MATLPERLPALVGAKVTAKEVACPAAKVMGSPKPLALNPVPLILICETETLEFPAFDSVTVCVPLAPVLMFPKLSEVGDAVSLATAETPVPEIASTSGELSALFASVRLPETLLADDGVKLTVNAAELPGATERGSVSPERPKPVPVSEAWVTLRFAVPGLLIVNIWVLVNPTVTLPKFALPGITEICG